RLLREPLFLTFLAAACLLQASHAVLYAFGTLHWRATGVSDLLIGWLWAVGVIAEIGLFAVGRRVTDRLSVAHLFSLAAAAGVARWCLLAVVTAPLPLIAVQTLHGLTFAATHLAAMHFITRAVPSHMAATAQSVYASSAAATMGIATSLAGLLYARWDG